MPHRVIPLCTHLAKTVIIQYAETIRQYAETVEEFNYERKP
jgi:hypothetical protein